MPHTSNKRIALVALAIVALDQATKFLVLQFLGFADELVIVPGFFRFVHWGNTGAAWSMFHGNNELLAIISLVALAVLLFTRHHFDIGTRAGQMALGLMFGGIVGNLIDRLMQSRRHVVDFLYFYVEKRGGGEAGFPAFNVADSAICVGVGLLFILSWKNGVAAEAKPATESGGAAKPS
jgi:signal peptidase II